MLRSWGTSGSLHVSAGWKATDVEALWFECFMRPKCRKWNLLNFKYISRIEIRVSVAGKPVLLYRIETLHPSPGIFRRRMLGVLDATKSMEVCVLEMKLQHWSKTYPSPLNLIMPIASIQRPDTLLTAPNSTPSGHQYE